MAKQNQNIVMMVMKTHNDQGHFYGSNPTCIGVPAKDSLRSIAEQGYIPLSAYMQLLSAGEDEQGTIDYINMLVRLARERLGINTSSFDAIKYNYLGKAQIDNRNMDEMLADIAREKAVAEHNAKVEATCKTILDSLEAAIRGC